MSKKFKINGKFLFFVFQIPISHSIRSRSRNPEYCSKIAKTKFKKKKKRIKKSTNKRKQNRRKKRTRYDSYLVIHETTMKLAATNEKMTVHVDVVDEAPARRHLYMS